MLNRLPLPSQLDRTIVLGGAIVGIVVTPIAGILLLLLALDIINAPEFVFHLIAGMITAGALGSVLLRNIVHAALSLVAALLGIAGIYLLLGSEFLALVQILIYGGGVTILLLFGLMLTRAVDDPIIADGAQKPFALGISVLIGAISVGAVLDAGWTNAVVSNVSIRQVGERLFRDYGLPFEIASLVLLVALIGAVAIARSDAEDNVDGTTEEQTS